MAAPFLGGSIGQERAKKPKSFIANDLGRPYSIRLWLLIKEVAVFHKIDKNYE
jgi:hypothetical protein